ncbi:right-handed parallel beta-helix repeat-containing protein [Sphingobium bisphenolivorans]|uniref:right-handed parallel beta-helix repeat-containing protein n=1 Tax=Sphingobium bisphenolivorans TaxID=1335760 RepID=UPI00039BFB14|nr:right-handed parallel beta-helix repeat-containing protein [Sphingobium bisphenolivorans]
MTVLCSAGLSSAASAASYYVDAVKGDDRFSGTSQDQPWKSIARIRDYPLQPGDRVLLAPGSVWKEPLTITRSGTANAPIVIAPAGDGPRPRIEAGGVSPHAVAVMNAEYVTVSGLEITNDAPSPGPRYGVLISAQDRGVTRGIRVNDLYIHDVRGTNDRKDNGGIIFSATGQRLATRFHDLRIERNIIWRVDRSGIAGISDRVTSLNWFPSEGVVIRDNYVEDVGGDGIVPRGTDGTLIEHNIVRQAGSRAAGYNAGIWQWSTDNSLIQLNEAAYTRTRYDGQGFDSDFNSRRTTILYNYSHDNAGGFLLICSPRPNDKDNLGNRGTVARFNVSRNDGSRIFQLSGNVSDALVERNVVHVGKGLDVQMVVATQWDGWARDVTFRDNIFKVAGTARYGSETGRNGPDYLIKAGFDPVSFLRFQGNSYLGSHVDRPEGEAAQPPQPFMEQPSDWEVPVFDPARPEGFSDFLVRHRSWMLTMLQRELNATVELKQARQTSFFDRRRISTLGPDGQGRPRDQAATSDASSFRKNGAPARLF